MFSILYTSGMSASDGGAPWAWALHLFPSEEEARAYIRAHPRSLVWVGSNPTCVVVPTPNVEAEAKRRGWRFVDQRVKNSAAT